ncbi:hypothetical protein [Afipia carboxidovorans]|uniref:hypothetical protein n=1 Tax=Afipia carboxidovorans TaxID=40137 RepID=UPI003085D91A|nr:hypothetical protein CRBSH125_21410 [Afipia carboxidovorans]
MPSSPSRGSAAASLLRDLVAVEDLVARLSMTAPETCEQHGGAQAILAGFGVVTCIGYWRLELGAAPERVALWEEMAAEHQAAHRGNACE